MQSSMAKQKKKLLKTNSHLIRLPWLSSEYRKVTGMRVIYRLGLVAILGQWINRFLLDGQNSRP